MNMPLLCCLNSEIARQQHTIRPEKDRIISDTFGNISVERQSWWLQNGLETRDLR